MLHLTHEKLLTRHLRKTFTELALVVIIEITATICLDEYQHTAVTATTLGLQAIRAIVTRGEVG